MFTALTFAIAALLAAPGGATEPAPQWPDLEPTNPWGLTVADWNGDGVSDVLVNNHRDGHPDLPDWHDLLLVSDGNTWRVELELPFADRHGCTALDADADGRLDFFCAVGADKGHGEGANDLWLQGADGWVEAGEAWGIDDPTVRGRFATAVDWDRDGLDDLFVGIAPHPELPDQHAAVWLNRGDHFEPVPVEQWGTHCAVPWRGGVVVCDVGPALGTTAWWLHPDAEPVDLGEYGDAASFGDRLVLVADDHVSIDGERVELPRKALSIMRGAVTADDRSIYVLAGGCTANDDPRVDLPDMVITRQGGRWVAADAPNGAGCTTTARHVDDRVLVMERIPYGAPAGGRLWLP